jgi:hypothetical protein
MIPHTATSSFLNTKVRNALCMRDLIITEPIAFEGNVLRSLIFINKEQKRQYHIFANLKRSLPPNEEIPSNEELVRMYSEFNCDKFHELHFGRITYVLLTDHIELCIRDNCGQATMPFRCTNTIKNVLPKAYKSFWNEMAKLTYPENALTGNKG